MRSKKSDGKTPVSKGEYEVLAAFRYALRQFMHFSEEAALSMGLTPQQHQALLAVKGFPGRDRVTIGELAERLQIKHHSAVGLVNRLVTQGLMVREADEQDRRQVFVSVTDYGEDVLAKLSVAHREELNRIGPHLNQLFRRLEGVSLYPAAASMPGHSQ